MSAEKYFLDTNVLVYTFDSSDERRCATARSLVSSSLQDGLGFISFQVVQEFLNVATRKFKVPLTSADAATYLTKVLSPLCEVFSGIDLYRRALDLKDRWRYGFYDSLILAGALAGGARRLYSEDLQHGQAIESLRIVNPFR